MLKQADKDHGPEKPRIVHLITTLDTGGAEAMLHKLLKNASRISSKHYSVISLTGDGTYGHRIRKLGIPVYSFHMKGELYDLNELRRLYYLLRRLAPNLLQTWLYHSDLIGLCLGRLARIKHIVWNIRCSNITFKHYALTTRLIFILLAKLSHLPSAVITNSEAGKRFHQTSGFSPRRWEVLPNGFDLEYFAPNSGSRQRVRNQLGVGDSMPVIGMVARHDPIKDHQTFFAAANLLRDKLPNTIFVLAGKGMEPSNPAIMKLVKGYRLENSIRLLGEISDIAELMSSFDLNTLSSLGEGFSNVLGEAMACGVPCVATDVGDAAMTIADTGYVVSPGNPPALAEAWLKFISASADMRERLGHKARERIEKFYSISHIVNRYERLYNCILES